VTDPSRPDRGDFFYRLLPALYQVRDLRLGQPLQALMQVLQSQYDVLHANLGLLYDDWFIATCSEWVVPYLGDLLAVPRIDVPHPWHSWRSLVANTIAWRRRKGTAATLARAVQGASGWPAVAVVYQDTLGATQSLLALRHGRGGTADLRDAAALAALGTPWNVLAHTVQVTSGPPAAGSPGDAAAGREIPGGAFNLPFAGLSVWRLQSYPVAGGAPCAVAPCCYTFHPFGVDTRLFNLPQSPADPTRAPRPCDLPMPLTRAGLREALAAAAAAETSGQVGPATPPAVAVELDSRLLPPGQISVADLAAWSLPPRGYRAAVDPELGRLTVAGPEQEVRVSFAWGFSGDVGGGAYVRPEESGPAAGAWRAVIGQRIVAAPQPDGEEHPFTSLAAALAAWEASGRHGWIEIVDDTTYPYPPGTESGWSLLLSGSRQLTITAAQGAFPCLRGDLEVASDGSEVGLTLAGLRVDGQVRLGGYAALGIRDCTLRPPLARPARDLAAGAADEVPPCLVATAGAAESVLELTRCLTGPLQLDPAVLSLAATSCLVDGGTGLAIGPPARASRAAAPPLALTTSTVFGRVAVQQLSATATIFREPVLVEQRETGGIAWSYVAPGSLTPRRYRCQPDLALAAASAPAQRRLGLLRLRPVFTATTYGQPGYGQLGAHCAPEILTGAADSAEMGVFHDLWQPQRRVALAAAVAEYLPWHLDSSLTEET